MLVKTRSGMVNTSLISTAERHNGVYFVTMTSGQTYTIDPDDMVNLLKKDDNLCRVATFDVVNLTHVESIEYRNYDYAVIMNGGQTVAGDPYYIKEMKQASS
jgi:hypothetical protein